jgi:prepilin-type N-terminal cleavage/methylation domain-containing protein
MQSERGFSIVEVLIALTVVVAGVCGLAQLFVLATAANMQAADTTRATVLARQKIEQLRTEPFDQPRSPPDALTRDTPGFFDVADRMFIRRWSVETLPADVNTLVLQVLVIHERHRMAAASARAATNPGNVRLFSVRTRRSP